MCPSAHIQLPPASVPGQRDARLALTRLQKEKDRPQEALRTYETLIDSVDPPPTQAYVDMLELYQQVGNENGRERVLEPLVEHRRNDFGYKILPVNSTSNKSKSRTQFRFSNTFSRRPPLPRSF